MIAVEFDKDSHANLQLWIDTLHDLSHILISVFDPQLRLIFTTDKISPETQERRLLQSPPRSVNHSAEFRLLGDGTAEALAPVFMEKNIVAYAMISRFYFEQSANPHDTLIINDMPVFDDTLAKSVLSLIAFGVTHCLKKVVTIDAGLQDRVDCYISDNLTKKITLRTLSSALHMSVEDLRIFFKVELNSNLPDYLRTKKIEKAKNLLINTNLSFREISEKIGLGEEKWVPLFVKAVSVTPEQYREYNRS